VKEPRRYAHNSTLPAPTNQMRKFDPERRARRESEGLVLGDHHAWIKRQPCELYDHPDHTCGFYPDRPRIEGHHLKTRGSGGQDRDNEIPVCPVGHDELEAAGNVSSQCERFGRDFRSIACEYTARFDAEMEEGESAEP
jgi:hypothetical protein